MDTYLARVVDLIDPNLQRIHNMTADEARERVLCGRLDAVREIDGSFALLATSGRTVKLARSLDRPMRYFLAKREEGPALVVADRIDALRAWLASEGLASQFHPSYTRMVPAHHVVTIELVGCPDPDPIYERFFDPERDSQPADLDVIGRHYIGALADEIAKHLRSVPEREPIGVCFSGGVDSGAVFVATYCVMQRLGLSLSRLKAFTLDLGGGEDLRQARSFLEKLGWGLFLEPIESTPDAVRVEDAVRTVEDYKPLDIECAAVGVALLEGIRGRYPDWRYLLDGDGGDENLKDYPIEENPELTIRSVVHNQMLYHEGWGVGRIKHSLTYSGGLSRSYARTYGPARRLGFEGFSPFTRPNVVEVAEGIPFIALTRYDVPALYALKGEIVARGVRQLFGLEMPIFEKRRFQHGAMPVERLRERIAPDEAALRRIFDSIHV